MSTNREASKTQTLAELLDSDITLEVLARQIQRMTQHLETLTALHAYLLRRDTATATQPTTTVAHNGSNVVIRVNPAVTPSPMEPQLPTPVKPVTRIKRESLGNELQAASDRVATYLAANPAGAGYNEIRSACRVSPAMFAAVISQVAGVIVRNPVTKLYTYVPPIKPPVEPIP